ncbi:hypothetical protein SAMN06295974_1910 [Plantibacter flavus]|uniref:Uncharacterized protein n=1 Tax=Plantibacter flavus TaxID=150123 RepID=A0A3N2BXP7_9MICO|nr:hypothetical protein [Plantibacter flavus]ROR80016.1 hypothetical protein EDD42_0047 [Plantibacter flavus]SMG28574.1 hypothetical protein SAMN06295974_1910 [Plantibacter flavus]
MSEAPSVSELYERWRSGQVTPAGISAAVRTSASAHAAATSTGHSSHVLEAWQAGHLYPSWGALNRLANALEVSLPWIMDESHVRDQVPANSDELLMLRYDRDLVALICAEGDEYPADFTAEHQARLGRAIFEAMDVATTEFAALIGNEPDGAAAARCVTELARRHRDELQRLRRALFGGDPLTPQSRTERRLYERLILGKLADAHNTGRDVLVGSTSSIPMRAVTVYGSHVILQFSASVNRRDKLVQLSCQDDAGLSTAVERRLWLRALVLGWPGSTPIQGETVSLSVAVPESSS